MNYVYDYAIKNNWELESSYPYKGTEKDCHHKPNSGLKIVTRYMTAEGLAEVVKMIANGPFAGSANANNMQFY